MTIDTSTLRGLRDALKKGDDLALQYQAQTGALSKTQQEASKRIADAKGVREAAEAEAQGKYAIIETDARNILNAANNKAGAAYGKIAEAENARVGDAQIALKGVEAALRLLEQEILDKYGVPISLFPGQAGGQTIRVG